MEPTFGRLGRDLEEGGPDCFVERGRAYVGSKVFPHDGISRLQFRAGHFAHAGVEDCAFVALAMIVQAVLPSSRMGLIMAVLCQRPQGEAAQTGQIGFGPALPKSGNSVFLKWGPGESRFLEVRIALKPGLRVTRLRASRQAESP